MDVTAVIPVWNGRELLAGLLAGLRAQTHPVAEVIVVDNGSTDGAPELAESRGARVIRMGRNTGFAPAVNRGLEACRTSLAAVLNNDVELAPDWLEKLLPAFGDPDTWFATGKIMDATRRDRVDGTWDAVSRAGCAWRVGSGRPDGPLFDQPRAVYTVPWTAAVFRTGLFERTGGLDETFESYLEDVDFGMRCARLGLKGMVLPDALAWHQGSATLGRWHPATVERIARNQVLLVAKHFPRRLLARWAWPVMVGQVLWGLVAVRHGAGFAFVRGKIAGLRKFSTVRRIAPPGRECEPGMAALMDEGEREIFRVQRATGFNPYWRMYFFLTGHGAS